LIDPEESSILISPPNQQPELLRDDKRLPVLAGINLELIVTKVFD
jgi:mannose/fructose-specific phosphotransferase system component IIA